MHHLTHEAVIAACVPHPLLRPPVSVSGGLLHTMYRADTAAGSYAVKVLNPMIMARREAADNMRRGEAIARALSGVVPAVCAIPAGGDVLREAGGQYALCYPWEAGRSVFYPEITPAHCAAMGDLLGRIHGAGLRPDTAEETSAPEDWAALLRCSAGQAWEAALAALLPDCVRWDAAAIRAAECPCAAPVLSHRDLDPKNVLWQEGWPLVIDWEAAGAVDPCRELLTVLRYWACTPEGTPLTAHAGAFLTAYRAQKCLAGIPWREVIAAGYSDLLGWLAYNIRRGVGMEAASAEEMALGQAQVTATLRTLAAQKETEDAILALLKDAG
ncbi:MAG: hypothetical protein E7458_04235 [Ruminococcaceae bacterium]|nr:hypothetical protein [Oscillospiraceae bacterium]